MRRTNVSLIIILTFILFTVTTSKAHAQPSVKRLWGQNRYQTAVAITHDGWKQADYAILAYGKNYPDAIAAAPLAMKYDAPILLTEKDSLDGDTKQELIRLGVQNVFIVGGTGVITPNVESELKSLNINVIRLAGNDRYETAVKIAEKLGNPNEVMIVTGDDFPDALSVAPAAAKIGVPILLIQPNKIPESVQQYISGKSISKAYIVGDETIVSDSTAKQFPFPCERVYGQDRYETNQAAITKFQDILNSNLFYVATGQDYADALTGSVLAAKNSAPILFMKDYPRQSVSAAFIYGKKLENGGKLLFGNYTTPVILGGVGAVSIDAENMLNNYKSVTQEAYAIPGFGQTFIGQMVIDRDWIYYIRLGVQGWDEGEELGENAIYKMKLDGTENTRLFFVGKDVSKYTLDYILNHPSEFVVNDKTITITKVDNGWIYYNVSGTGYDHNYKMRTDGTGNQVI